MCLYFHFFLWKIAPSRCLIRVWADESFRVLGPFITLTPFIHRVGLQNHGRMNDDHKNGNVQQVSPLANNFSTTAPVGHFTSGSQTTLGPFCR